MLGRRATFVILRISGIIISKLNEQRWKYLKRKIDDRNMKIIERIKIEIE